MKVVLGLMCSVLLCAFALGQDAPQTVPSPQIDEKAKAILRDNEQAMFALKTYSAECWTTSQAENKKPEYELAVLTALKPNRIRYDAWDVVKKAGKLIKKQETPKSTLACDGNTVYRQEGSVYRSQKYTGPNELYTLLEPWTGFFITKHSLRAIYAANGSETLRYAGKGLVEGVLCDVIAFNYSSTISGESNGIVSEIRSENEGYLYFGPDKLVRRRIISTGTHISSGENKLPPRNVFKDSIIRKVRKNFAPPPVSTFEYTPPEGATGQVDKPLFD